MRLTASCQRLFPGDVPPKHLSVHVVLGLDNFIVAERCCCVDNYCLHPHSGCFFVSRLSGAQQAKAHNKKAPDPSNGSGAFFKNTLDCLEKILIRQDFHYKPACTSIASLRYRLAICLCCP